MPSTPRTQGIGKALWPVLLPVLLTGCQFGKPEQQALHYKTVVKDARRDTAAATKHNAAALGLIKQGNYSQAEKDLTAALSADLFFGPAHNNLGSVYFHRKDYYRAAWEFQYAAKLMPGRAEPLYNLAMVFEAVGSLDKAAQWYEKAQEVEPENVKMSGFDANQSEGTYTYNGVPRVVAQKTIVIPGKDGLFVLQLNADARQSEKDVVIEAAKIIDEQTKITA